MKRAPAATISSTIEKGVNGTGSAIDEIFNIIIKIMRSVFGVVCIIHGIIGIIYRAVGVTHSVVDNVGNFVEAQGSKGRGGRKTTETQTSNVPALR